MKRAAATPTLLPTPAAGEGATTVSTDTAQRLVQHVTTSGSVDRGVDNSLAVTEVGQGAIETGVSSAVGRDGSIFDSDPNYGRSKRRRTASPETHSLLDHSPSKRTWQTQLEAAAHYEFPYKQKEVECPLVMQRNGEAAIAVIGGHEDAIPETAGHPGGSVENQDLAPPANQTVESIALNTTELPSGILGGQPQNNDPPEPKTPEKKRTPTKGASKKTTPTNKSPRKKILKLSSDGKLGSPRSRAAAATHPRNKGKSKSTSGKQNSGTGIIAIKYGSNEESRASMAQRIQDILISTTAKRGIDIAQQAKATKPPLPQKSTHPFFLGLPGRETGLVKNSTNTVVSAVGPRPQLALGQNSSPNKAKHADGARARAEAWSALAGFGGRPSGQHDLRAIKIPGAETPLWPPKDMVHIRDIPSIPIGMRAVLPDYRAPHTDRKMKGATVEIPEQEDLLVSVTRNLCSLKNGTKTRPHPGHRIPDSLRVPIRRVMTGRELQQAVRLRLKYTFPATGAAAPRFTESLQDTDIDQSPTYSALSQLYKRLPLSQSAFDKAECESQAWAQKYAPKCANDVLQQGHEAIMLRDWMKNLTVTSVHTGNKDPSSTRASSVASKRHKIKSKRKKRRRAEELDGFIISSDEEAIQMDEFTDPDAMPSSPDRHSASRKTVIRARDTLGISRPPSDTRTINAVVISGPHGCGKTATVYALALELDFEVFEINAGSRRSGRDVLDRVGDMTRNHLVQQSNGTEIDDGDEDLLQLTQSLKQDLESGRQANMNSFFKPKLETGKRPKLKTVTKSNQPKVEQPTKKLKNQKQSLILLEEVDVLFDEDKQFWMTTLSLILQSKRPIVMTCTDETLLPLDEMALYGIFRFVPAPEALVTDYLLLVGANEGHLLSPDAMLALYRSKRRDLRASITELQFYCQMGIGDTKGGLEWMLIGRSPDETLKETQGVLRVVSDGTYLEGMGWLGCDHISLDTKPTASEERELMLEAWNNWGIKSEDRQMSEAEIEYLTMEGRGSKGTFPESALPSQRLEHLKALENLDQACEALSASDNFPALGFRCDNTVSVFIDCTVT